MSLNPFQSLRRPCLNLIWRPGEPGIPNGSMALEIKGHFRASSFPSLSRKEEALEVRKLLVLTHRTRGQQSRKLTHSVSMVPGRVAPLPFRGSPPRLGVRGGGGALADLPCGVLLPPHYHLSHRFPGTRHTQLPSCTRYPRMEALMGFSSSVPAESCGDPVSRARAHPVPLADPAS